MPPIHSFRSVENRGERCCAADEREHCHDKMRQMCTVAGNPCMLTKPCRLSQRLLHESVVRWTADVRGEM